MNIGDTNSNEILFLNFNQDFSCVSIGTEKGYRIYNCDPFGKCYSKRKFSQFWSFSRTNLYVNSRWRNWNCGDVILYIACRTCWGWWTASIFTKTITNHQYKGMCWIVEPTKNPNKITRDKRQFVSYHFLLLFSQSKWIEED